MNSGWQRLGERVAAARGVRRWSTRDLADAADLSLRTIQAIEAGTSHGFSPVTIGRIEDALGWQPGSVRRIVEGMEPRPSDDPKLERLRQMWDQLTDEQRAVLIAIAETLIRQR